MECYYPKNFRNNFFKSLAIFLIFIAVGILTIYILLKNSSMDYSVKFSPINTNLSIVNILFTNFSVILIALLGIFTFKVSSYFILIVNGFSLGFILGANAITTGKFIYFLRIILTHGITEVSAICLAAAIGLYGKQYFYIFNKKEIFIQISTVLILYFVSAVIETYITPMFW
jgi:stage II sporulation protein M